MGDKLSEALTSTDLGLILERGVNRAIAFASFLE